VIGYNILTKGYYWRNQL